MPGRSLVNQSHHCRLGKYSEIARTFCACCLLGCARARRPRLAKAWSALLLRTRAGRKWMAPIANRAFVAGADAKREEPSVSRASTHAPAPGHQRCVNGENGEMHPWTELGGSALPHAACTTRAAHPAGAAHCCTKRRGSASPPSPGLQGYFRKVQIGITTAAAQGKHGPTRQPPSHAHGCCTQCTGPRTAARRPAPLPSLASWCILGYPCLHSRSSEKCEPPRRSRKPAYTGCRTSSPPQLRGYLLAVAGSCCNFALRPLAAATHASRARRHRRYCAAPPLSRLAALSGAAGYLDIECQASKPGICA